MTVCWSSSLSCTTLSRGSTPTSRLPISSANEATRPTSPATLRQLQMTPPSRARPDEANFTMPAAMLLAAYSDIISPLVTRYISSALPSRMGMAKPPHTTSPNTSYTT